MLFTLIHISGLDIVLSFVLSEIIETLLERGGGTIHLAF